MIKNKISGRNLIAFNLAIIAISLTYIRFDQLAVYPIVLVVLATNGIVLALPNKLKNLGSFIVLFFMSLYFVIQTVFNRAFHLYGFISTAISMRNNAVGFISSIREFILPIDYWIISVPFIFYLSEHFWSKKHTSIKFKSKARVFVLFCMFITMLITYQSFKSSIMQKSVDFQNRIGSPEYIYNEIPDTNSFVSTFGLFGMLVKESELIFTPKQVQETIDINDQIAALFSSNQSINPNSFSGLFKDKSLLLIEAESLNNLVIDPVLTPTLYRLKSQGIFVDGYNSPLLTGSTSDTEFMVNTSLLPANDGLITFEDYSNNLYPLSLAKTFSQNGYYSMASHNNFGMYYNREEMLPNLGYDFFDAVRLGAKDNVEDSYVLNQIKWIMYEQEKYFSFWITFNAHQPYSKDALIAKMPSYFDVVEKTYPNLPEAEKVYYAKTIDLDRALKQLLIDYKNSNRIDDLVIIIYGDHYPKGLFQDTSIYQEMCSNNGLTMSQCFKTPLIIWNNDSIQQMVEKSSSPLDILPTIMDLFGLQIDVKQILGHSIFDPNYNGFNFDEFGVIQTDEFVYDFLRNSLVQKQWNKSNEEYLTEAQQLYERFQLGFKIVENNYFASEAYQQSTLEK